MNRTIAFYGMICGAVLALYIWLLDFSKVVYTTTWGPYLGYLAILILPIGIYMTLRQWKKHYQVLLFKHSLMIGLIIALLASTTYCAYIFVDIHFFDAQHLSNLYEFTKEEMQKAGYSVTQIQLKMDKMRMHYTSSQPYINTYVMYVAMGMFYGVIFYFIFRFKKSNQTIQL